jgi:hypothetical protein
MTSAPAAFTPERWGRAAGPVAHGPPPDPPDAPGHGRPGRPTAAYGGAVLPTGRRATALLTGLLLSGCALTTAPGTGAPAGPRPLPPTSTAPAAADVTLPWPAATAAEATTLQAQVDRGAQPWLLDPSEVAIAYAAAAHDWPHAEAYPGPDGTSVDVRNANGERIILSLAQPSRTGSDGIWVVTAEHK